MGSGIRDERRPAFFWLTPFATRLIRRSVTDDDPSTPNVFAVYMALCELANDAHAREHIGEDSEPFEPPRKRIAAAAVVSTKTADRCLTALERMQLIRVEKNSDGETGSKANTYVLVEPVTRGGDSQSLGGGDSQSPLEEEGELLKKNPSKAPPSDEREGVWEFYVATMKPRRSSLGPEEKKVIAAARRVASAEELKAAIKACERSDYHMKRGQFKDRKGRKYNSLASILGPKKRKGETQRDRIDFWLERASEQANGSEVRFDQEKHREELKEAQGL